MDTIAASAEFHMYGARDIMSRTGIQSVIGAQVLAIEGSIASSPALAFDLSRALVETVCKTILSERGKDTPNGMKDLLKATYREINLLPGANGGDIETLEKIKELINGFEAVIGCVSHLRHTFGICSHGRSVVPYDAESAHAILAARAADTVVHFLYLAHKNFLKAIVIDKLEYFENGDFNQDLDLSHEEIEIMGQNYHYSEVAFMVDVVSYESALIAYGEESAESEEDES